MGPDIDFYDHLQTNTKINHSGSYIEFEHPVCHGSIHESELCTTFHHRCKQCSFLEQNFHAVLIFQFFLYSVEVKSESVETCLISKALLKIGLK